MPKVEKAIHLQAFKLYMEMGGMSKAFLSAFVGKFGKSGRTAERWQKDLNWKERANVPIDEAIVELEETGKLDPSEIILGFLDLVRHRMTEAGERVQYMKGIFATAFDRIPTPENTVEMIREKKQEPLEIKDILDMDRLSRSIQRIMREEQAWIRSTLLLIGEPEAITEDRILVEFVGLDEDEFRNAEQSLPDDTARVSEGNKEIPNTS